MSVDRVSDAFENGPAFASSVTFSSNLLSEQMDFQGSVFSGNFQVKCWFQQVLFNEV